MAPDEQISLLLADDHRVFREGIRSLLAAAGKFRIEGEASTGREAIEKVNTYRPQVVLMDISMPDMSGLDATAEIRRTHPRTRVVFLTMHETEEYFFRAIQIGASGYITKEAAFSELVSAIETAARGEIALHPPLATKLVDDYLRRVGTGEERRSFDDLTPRQREILRLVGDGLTSKEIADALSLSIHTVQAHRAHIMNRLGLRTRGQLMKYAARIGLLS